MGTNLTKVTKEDTEGSGPLVQALAERLDQCSFSHNYCLACPSRQECYKIWLEVIKKSDDGDLKMKDFLVFYERFNNLVTCSESCLQPK